ncbi:MAG TPA: extracellular solute-binding protein [Candidatus Lumbricidophila sp.]|nr:extracellular solute-binding protein [Candidatus Lumbricidophila sp.]
MQSHITRRTAIRGVAALAAFATAGLGLSACAPSGSSGGGISQADIDAALKSTTDITLDVWGWNDAAPAYAEFTKKYPHIKVNWVKNEGPGDVLTKFQNAVKAGSGGPDLLGVEYQAISQLALPGSLQDLSAAGLTDTLSQYVDSVRKGVQVNGKPYALPNDQGPMVMIYNKALYAQAGVTSAPKTWEEFADAAKKIHALAPDAYIANAPDAGLATSLLWASGSKAFQASSAKDLKINLQDDSAKKVATLWGDLAKEGLLSPVGTWSDEWNRALDNNKLATLLMGSWMINGLDDHAKPAGSWDVAQIPSFDGKPASAMNGGSGIAMAAGSKKKAAAAGLLQFLSNPDTQLANALAGKVFPSIKSVLSNKDFLGQAFKAYKPGFKANEQGLKSAESVVDGWQYLPFQGYANDAYKNYVSKAFTEKTDVNAAFVAWQKDLVDYGTSQGFNVNK